MFFAAEFSAGCEWDCIFKNQILESGKAGLFCELSARSKTDKGIVGIRCAGPDYGI